MLFGQIFKLNLTIMAERKQNRIKIHGKVWNKTDVMISYDTHEVLQGLGAIVTAVCNSLYITAYF